MSWWQTALIWYGLLFILGLIFIPTTKRLFGRFFPDIGYPFAKAIAVLALSYTAFVAATIRILPFSRWGLLILLLLFLALNLWLLSRKQQKQNAAVKPRLGLIVFEEFLFLAGFFAWVWVRGQEPAIRDLEKLMDFGFMKSILNASFFPPSDMWLAGKTINYYYFGHLTGAVFTKISGFSLYKTYNLILAAIFALGVSQVFSLGLNIVYTAFKSWRSAIAAGALSSFLVNFAGNLHPIYLFTRGYPNDKPLPFWQILGQFNPVAYWYPNATRFIPLTIHEFPIYSYVVADLHGHVFDIPFVLLTITVLFMFFIRHKTRQVTQDCVPIAMPILLGFLTAIHYMTNAFDGPIYIFLTLGVFFLIFRLTRPFFIAAGILIASFLIFSLPFSLHFSPFATGIGVNCAPQFLVNLKKLGPFLFEVGKCQISPLWMILVLWGFFWFNLILFLTAFWRTAYRKLNHINYFILLLFALSTVLVVIPEFFYVKDIYPAHFRANTMFKLGYQAFMMMGIASGYTFFFFKNTSKTFLFFIFYLLSFTLVALYPGFAISSYYGKLKKTPELDGSLWLKSQLPEYKEIIDYLDQNAEKPTVILEAQGDSYTTFNIVSAYTGLPTVAGWWVHEWLWRGSSDAVGKRIPDINAIFEDDDVIKTLSLIKKYHIKYIIVGLNEREKYKNLKEEKLAGIARLIFTSSNGKGRIYNLTY